MSMYLPNSDLGPTGSEMTEFIDIRPMAESSSSGDQPPGPGDGTTMPLDARTRRDIARRASAYIAGLVADHNGDPADVRSVIHELHGQRAVDHHDGRAAGGPSSPASGPRGR